MSKSGEWRNGIWYPAKPIKDADITIRADTFRELMSLRERLADWKASIKKKRGIESEIRSLAQKKFEAEKEVESHVASLMEIVTW